MKHKQHKPHKPLTLKTNFSWIFTRVVIDTPFEVDSNRCELGRSPGSRFVEWKLPSQRISAPVAYSLRFSTLTVAGPLRICTGFPCNTKSLELYGTLQNSVKSS